jgi:hypothetical protein
MLNIETLDTPETVTLSITIPKATRDQVGLYARLVNRTVSDVIGIMLDRFMERDKEFQKQLSQQPALDGARETGTKRDTDKPGSEAVR